MKCLGSILVFLLASSSLYSQGVGIPSKKGGIGFGNLPTFTGVRFNFADRNVERITGINVTIWQPKNSEAQSGYMRGLAIGLPMVMGVENQSGIGFGIAGVGAKKSLTGINIGGLGLGAGERVAGINLAGLGIGSGGSLSGITSRVWGRVPGEM